ncbi:arylesterase [Pyruvatibacter sp. HU-CL02332]|uniref:SMP-30/gluconolactonase/LRE family protein n=1 Tax=Pyruvatibacter sp. HU-CL02332 TaxID=3127650 RepID=UPI0031078EDE
MNRFLKIALILVAVVVVLASAFYVRTMNWMGEFTTITRKFDGESCMRVQGVPGPEDVAIDRSRGIAYISAYDRRLASSDDPGASGVRGGIYVMDLNADAAGLFLRPITPLMPEAFRPHGISLFTAADGTRTLMAVNHPGGDDHTVEIFDLSDDDVLTHRRTVRDPLIMSPNDVAAVSPEAFYVTNDHDRPGQDGRTLAALFASPITTVVYHDGSASQVVADELALANGVAVSGDMSKVYVTELLARTLHIFDRDPSTGGLTLSDQVFLGTGVDNIDVAEDGALWIGAHPQLATFGEHAADPANLSPSQIVVVRQFEGGGGEASTAYLDDGSEISASSVGATYKNLLVIGAVFDPAVLVCDMGGDVAAPSAAVGQN